MPVADRDGYGNLKEKLVKEGVRKKKREKRGIRKESGGEGATRGHRRAIKTIGELPRLLKGLKRGCLPFDRKRGHPPSGSPATSAVLR